MRVKRGSPPRVRGEVLRFTCALSAMRITPACAGRRRWYIQSSNRAKDHPRVCGEKLWPRRSPAVVSGSPPRVRGEDDAKNFAINYQGITPACAGRRGMK